MPSKTPKQARAMRAASVGKSNIGIPKSVGQDFVQADKRQAQKKSPAKNQKSKR